MSPNLDKPLSASFQVICLLPQDSGYGLIASVFYIRYKMQMHGKAQQSLKLAQKEARKMENSLSLSDEREGISNAEYRLSR